MKQKLHTLFYWSAVLSIITLSSSIGNHAKAQVFCTHRGAYKLYGDFDGDRFFWTCGETEGVANSFLGKMHPEALLDKDLITHQVCL
jgi:hypothetical protein